MCLSLYLSIPSFLYWFVIENPAAKRESSLCSSSRRSVASIASFSTLNVCTRRPRSNESFIIRHRPPQQLRPSVQRFMGPLPLARRQPVIALHARKRSGRSRNSDRRRSSSCSLLSLPLFYFHGISTCYFA